MYFRQRRFGDALREFHELTKRFPNDSAAASDVASILNRLGHPRLAFACLKRALTLDRTNIAALITLAEVLKELGDFAASLETYEAALCMAPADPKLRMQCGMTRVMLGEWLKGWVEMEQREAFIGIDVLYGELPSTQRWTGREPIGGKRLLVLHEQGLGDSIMCVRFAEALTARGATVLFRTKEPLVPLLSTAPGVAECSVHGTSYPDHDLYVPLMSLMHVLEITPDRLNGAAYLAPQGECPERLGRLLPRDGQPTIALAWSGNPHHENDHRRSIPGELLAPLLRCEGIRFVALQKTPPVSSVLPADLHDRIIDVGESCHSFNDSAHVLRRVDLLVTVDTAVAHLAGSLGVPTLVCLPFTPDFRWGVSGSTTPWYDSVTLVRQRETGDWESVLTEVRQTVEQLRDNRLACGEHEQPRVSCRLSYY